MKRYDNEYFTRTEYEDDALSTQINWRIEYIERALFITAFVYISGIYFYPILRKVAGGMLIIWFLVSVNAPFIARKLDKVPEDNESEGDKNE